MKKIIRCEVINMLFRKKMDRCCRHCANCTNLDENTVLCTKKGVTATRENCRKFVYDPTKRIPVKAKAVDFSKFEEYDYSL